MPATPGTWAPLNPDFRPFPNGGILGVHCGWSVAHRTTSGGNCPFCPAVVGVGSRSPESSWRLELEECGSTIGDQCCVVLFVLLIVRSVIDVGSIVIAIEL
jgi:hypothetical protein